MSKNLHILPTLLTTATLMWLFLLTGQAFAQKQGLKDSTLFEGEVPRPRLQKENRSYNFYVNKQINYNEASLTVDIAKGSKIVFEYVYDSGGDARVDANYREKIVFEIDSGDGIFQITDSSIAHHNVYYGQLCMCVDRGYQQVKKGSVQGMILENGNWYIEVDLIAIGRNSKKEYQHSFEAEFIRSEK